MDTRREEFMERLRATFREEASEHMAAIARDLLALETENTDSARLVESVFRETHSLKGAARSVGLKAVERVCVEVETVFRHMKDEGVEPTPEVLDASHLAIGVLERLLEEGESGSDSSKQAETIDAIQALRAAVGPGDPEGSRQAPDGDHDAPPTPMPDPPATPMPPPEAEQPERRQRSPRSAVARVSVEKLFAVQRRAEEIAVHQRAVRDIAALLGDLGSEMAGWNRGRERQMARAEVAKSARGVFDSELLFTRHVERSLGILAQQCGSTARTLRTEADAMLDEASVLLLVRCGPFVDDLAVAGRRLAASQRKEVEFVVGGGDLEVSRRILEQLKAPLTHLVRNAVDHGVETPEERRRSGKPARARVELSLQMLDNGHLQVSVSDDGRGLDFDTLRAAAGNGDDDSDDALVRSIFQSGVTTRTTVTDLSGHGLGLAIVREKVEELRGSVEASSSSGRGTTIRLTMPSSLSAFRAVLVEVADQTFVIPTDRVIRVMQLPEDAIRIVENRPTISVENHPVSVLDVSALLGRGPSPDGARRSGVLVQSGARQAVLMVDHVVDEQDVRVHTLSEHFSHVSTVSGAVLSKFSGVLPMLNPDKLVDLGGSAPSRPARGQEFVSGPERRDRILVAEDSITSRMLLKHILEGAGYDVTTAVDGLDAIRILRSDPFDILVSDVDMPRMNGFELTAKVRATPGIDDLPVVLVTALSSASDREFGMEVGANAYIVKSDFDQGNLLAVLERLS